jgi:ribosomal protein L4
MKEKLLAIAMAVESEQWTQADIVALRKAAEDVGKAKDAVSGLASVNLACREAYKLLQ